MIVVELFIREHALFRALLDRLEVDLARRQARAHSDLCDALRALLPALDRHAEIEDIVFHQRPDEPEGDSRALAEVAAQHRALAALRSEMLFALEQAAAPYPFARLKSLTETLISGVRQHLSTEETRLWPLYRTVLAGSLDAVMPVPLERRAQALELSLRRAIAAIASDAPADSPES